MDVPSPRVCNTAGVDEALQVVAERGGGQSDMKPGWLQPMRPRVPPAPRSVESRGAPDVPARPAARRVDRASRAPIASNEIRTNRRVSSSKQFEGRFRTSTFGGGAQTRPGAEASAGQRAAARAGPAPPSSRRRFLAQLGWGASALAGAACGLEGGRQARADDGSRLLPSIRTWRSSSTRRPRRRACCPAMLVMPGEKATILMRFVDSPGTHLYHCHNLEHEDAGMMRNFRRRCVTRRQRGRKVPRPSIAVRVRDVEGGRDRVRLRVDLVADDVERDARGDAGAVADRAA